MKTTSKEALLALCRSLPGATEDVKWENHIVFSVGGKMFAIFDLDDAEPLRVKVDPDEFPILCQQPGISPSPYLSRQSWVRMEHPRVLPAEPLEDLVRESYQIVVAKLPRRVREQLTAG